MKHIKKHSFTLLEVLVSLSLLSFLLFFFFGHLKTSVKVKNRLAQAQKITYKRSYFQQRIGDLLSKIEPALLKEDIKKNAFFVDDIDGFQEVHFVFDAGIDPEIEFSDVLRGKIYLNKKQQLLLEISSRSENNPQIREEILFDHVTSFKTECYVMPKPFDRNRKKITDSYVKKTEWEENSPTIPAIVRMFITYKSHNTKKLKQLTYSFFPNSKIKEILYQK